MGLPLCSGSVLSSSRFWPLVPGEKILGLDCLRRQAARALPEDFCELVVKASWLNPLRIRYRWTRHFAPSVEKWRRHPPTICRPSDSCRRRLSATAPPDFASSKPLSTLWFACARLSQPRLPDSRPGVSATLTIVAFETTEAGGGLRQQNLTARLEGSSFISRTVAHRRVDRRYITRPQDAKRLFATVICCIAKALRRAIYRNGRRSDNRGHLIQTPPMPTASFRA